MRILCLFLLGSFPVLCRASGVPTRVCPSPGDSIRVLPLSDDSILVHRLLTDLASRQVAGDGFYYSGTFPGSRVNSSHPDRERADNNIFFSGLIAMGLQNLRSGCSPADRALCDSMVARAGRAYPYYRNRSGRMTFNFWKTNPPQIFPGDPLLRHLDRTHALPDDLDDSSILMDSMDLPDSTLRVVKALMEANANGARRTVHNYYRRYKPVRAYSTWFGKRMPADLDCSVICNVLYWVCRNHLPFSATDSASVALLRDMIGRGLPWKDPAYLSPHYSRTPVILYHIGRLLGACAIPALDSLRPLLVKETRVALAGARGYLDKVLLSTTLLRLGVQPGDIPLIPVGSIGEDDDRFVFFVASFSDYFRNPFRRIFLHSRLIRYEFRCLAYNRFLLLEYLVLRAENSGDGSQPPPTDSGVRVG
jgi:hypothetical protein